MVTFSYTFAFICCACDFMYELKSEREMELVSIVSLFELENSYKECSQIVCKGCIDRGVQIEIAFVLISSKVQSGPGACKECAGWVKASGLLTWVKR
jgi:hypothetical protein